MDGFFLSGASLQSLASAWMSSGPKGSLGVRRQLDFPAQGALWLYNCGCRGEGRRLFPSHTAIPGRRHQLLNGKEDSCQQKGGEWGGKFHSITGKRKTKTEKCFIWRLFPLMSLSWKILHSVIYPPLADSCSCPSQEKKVNAFGRGRRDFS